MTMMMSMTILTKTTTMARPCGHCPQSARYCEQQRQLAAAPSRRQRLTIPADAHRQCSAFCHLKTPPAEGHGGGKRRNQPRGDRRWSDGPGLGERRALMSG
jgi:hypothetical protein